ncbi:unnamed protein product [Bursaphelenchus okinawaensis]|uniref:C-type lectin domain-containing protein n=1 Tax=Bursaphelenchus okinawaensis TaxID=465554 RepID=A0A811L189_9BILA|nr:unnamed protein product [Bursaphelenchus okinawaensis]CAG9114914.1 unnamed protein product [Bursaphelenchus okinawaensis]
MKTSILLTFLLIGLCQAITQESLEEEESLHTKRGYNFQNPIPSTPHSPWISGPSDKKYQFHIGQQSWLAAREICLTNNADLVTISNQDELDWIISHYKPQSKHIKDRQVQIGLYADVVEDELTREWRWVNGDYVNNSALSWVSGEPFDHSNGRERCGLLNINTKTLDDVDCELGGNPVRFYRFICQRTLSQHIKHEELNNPLWKKLEDILVFFGISDRTTAKNDTKSHEDLKPTPLEEEEEEDEKLTRVTPTAEPTTPTVKSTESPKEVKLEPIKPEETLKKDDIVSESDKKIIKPHSQAFGTKIVEVVPTKEDSDLLPSSNFEPLQDSAKVESETLSPVRTTRADPLAHLADTLENVSFDGADDDKMKNLERIISAVHKMVDDESDKVEDKKEAVTTKNGPNGPSGPKTKDNQIDEKQRIYGSKNQKLNPIAPSDTSESNFESSGQEIEIPITVFNKEHKDDEVEYKGDKGDDEESGEHEEKKEGDKEQKEKDEENEEHKEEKVKQEEHKEEKANQEKRKEQHKQQKENKAQHKLNQEQFTEENIEINEEPRTTTPKIEPHWVVRKTFYAQPYQKRKIKVSEPHRNPERHTLPESFEFDQDEPEMRANSTEIPPEKVQYVESKQKTEIEQNVVESNDVTQAEQVQIALNIDDDFRQAQKEQKAHPGVNSGDLLIIPKTSAEELIGCGAKNLGGTKPPAVTTTTASPQDLAEKNKKIDQVLENLRKVLNNSDSTLLNSLIENNGSSEGLAKELVKAAMVSRDERAQPENLAPSAEELESLRQKIEPDVLKSIEDLGRTEDKEFQSMETPDHDLEAIGSGLEPPSEKLVLLTPLALTAHQQIVTEKKNDDNADIVSGYTNEEKEDTSLEGKAREGEKEDNKNEEDKKNEKKLFVLSSNENLEALTENDELLPKSNETPSFSIATSTVIPESEEDLPEIKSTTGTEVQIGKSAVKLPPRKSLFPDLDFSLLKNKKLVKEAAESDKKQKKQADEAYQALKRLDQNSLAARIAASEAERKKLEQKPNLMKQPVTVKKVQQQPSLIKSKSTDDITKQLERMFYDWSNGAFGVLNG